MTVSGRLLGALVMLLGTLLVGCAPKPGREVGIRSSPSEGIEYSVTFGDVEQTSVVGTYMIPVSTNLPEGTVLFPSFDSKYLGGSGPSIVVVHGSLQLTLINNGCADEGGGLVSPPTTLTLIVAWEYRQFSQGPPGPSTSPISAQPPEVLAVLGQDLEHLQGPQVRQVDGMNELVASDDYQLPVDTCTAKFIPGPKNDYSQQVPITPSPG